MKMLKILHGTIDANKEPIFKDLGHQLSHFCVETSESLDLKQKWELHQNLYQSKTSFEIKVLGIWPKVIRNTACISRERHLSQSPVPVNVRLIGFSITFYYLIQQFTHIMAIMNYNHPSKLPATNNAFIIGLSTIRPQGGSGQWHVIRSLIDDLFRVYWLNVTQSAMDCNSRISLHLRDIRA